MSIGLPVYNGERYLSESLNSLLGQTYEDFELIISDNASSDRTEEICHSYALKDGRIRYFRNNANLGAARNYRRVFELSSGEYFRWATCDDLSAPESLSRCVSILDEESLVVLVYPKTKLIDEHGRVISEYDDGLNIQSPKPSQRLLQVFHRLGLCNAFYGLMRRDVLARTGLMGDYIGSDQVFLAELSLYGRFWEIAEFLFCRRLHPGAYSSRRDVSELLEFYKPLTPRRPPMIKWRHLWEYLVSVGRAPIGTAEKIRCAYYIARQANSARDKLVSELRAMTHHVLRRSRASPPL